MIIKVTKSEIDNNGIEKVKPKNGLKKVKLQYEK